MIYLLKCVFPVNDPFCFFCNDLLIIGVYIIEKAEGLSYWHVNKLSWNLYISHLQYSAKILQVKKHGVKVFLTRYFVMCIQYEICPLFGYILLSIDLKVKKRKRCRKPRTSGEEIPYEIYSIWPGTNMYRNIHTMEKSTIAQKQNTTNFGDITNK